jgi:ribose transport system substrate-binding protein
MSSPTTTRSAPRRRLRAACALAFALLPVLLAAAGCGGGESASAAQPGGRPQLAFVTNCVASFWTVATFGVAKARQDFGVDVDVRMPPDGTVEQQKRFLDDLLAKGVQGIAVSPIDPANMTALLDRVAERTLLVTHDSDAPKSRRLCYVGMDNYDAGRMCGQLVEEAIPQGGAVVIVVGNLDQDNARGRRQGLVDELLGRSHDRSRFDPQDAVLKGERWEVRATFTDEFNRSKTKAVAEDSLVRWQDVACMVGLFEYEPPLLLEAVKLAGRLGKVAVVGFDENEATLQGIVDGTIHGTIVQNPYEYALKSLELLAQLAREPDAGKRAALLPASRWIDIPARAIRKADVQAFWADLKSKTGQK